MAQPSAVVHYPRRVRNELRFRQLTVLRCEDIAPALRRIVLGGPDLDGFSSDGFDDHCKLFFPAPGQVLTPPQVTESGIVWPGDVRPAGRDYTPLFDRERQELAFDFYLHDAGVACQWARDAVPGAPLIIGGPRGSLVVPVEYHWQLYVCDESGLPALRRRLETIAASGQRPAVRALVSLYDMASQAYLDGLAPWADISWFAAGDEASLAEQLAQITVPAQDYFVWITGEGKQVKRLSAPLEAQLDPQLLRAAAYWHIKP